MAKKQDTTQPNIRTFVNRVESVVELDNYRAEVAKPDEFMGRAFIAMGYEIMNGRHGDFVHIEAIDVMDEKPVVISTGGILIMQALSDIQAKSGFPFVATFGKSGNAFVFRSANVNRNIDLNGMVERYLYGEQQELPLDNNPYETS